MLGGHELTGNRVCRMMQAVQPLDACLDGNLQRQRYFVRVGVAAVDVDRWKVRHQTLSVCLHDFLIRVAVC